jgi:hypothetical protein
MLVDQKYGCLEIHVGRVIDGVSGGLSSRLSSGISSSTVGGDIVGLINRLSGRVSSRINDKPSGSPSCDFTDRLSNELRNGSSSSYVGRVIDRFSGRPSSIRTVPCCFINRPSRVKDDLDSDYRPTKIDSLDHSSYPLLIKDLLFRTYLTCPGRNINY